MAQEERELLLIDLCGRLSHDIKVDCNGHIYYLNEINVGNKVIDFISVLIQDEKRLHYPIQTLIDNIKPYLRPMSSMTEEETEEYRNIDNRSYSCPLYIAHIPASRRIDWLNAHHFDYRELIPKGLAIEAPEGMYN